MYVWMRNTHLAIGLAAFLTAVIFFVSSVAFSYRDELVPEPEVHTRSVSIPAAQAPHPRGLAETLIRDHGLRGTFRGPDHNDEERFEIQIARLGVSYRVDYDRATGRAEIRETRVPAVRTAMSIHVLNGWRKPNLLENLWAVLTGATALGMTLLGISGIYLWFKTYAERRAGAVIFAAGLLWGVGSLVWIRL